MKNLYVNGSRMIVSFNVTEAKSQKSKSGKHQIVLKDGEDAVFFTDQDEGRGLASRIDKMAEKSSIIGAKMIIDVTKGDNGVMMANAFSFGREMFTMKNGENTEYVFVGYPTHPEDWTDPRKSANDSRKNFSFRMAIRQYDRTAKENKLVYYKISFTTAADAARKLITPDFQGLAAVHVTSIVNKEATNPDGSPRVDKDGNQIVYHTAYADELTIV